VTPDRERQAWREAVRTFRLAATMLKDPAPDLYAELAIPEVGLRDLAQELSLVAFSPFEALPDDVAYGRGGEPHRPAADPGRISDRATGRGTAGAGPPGGSQDIPRAAPRRPYESTDQPPVFSFRRGGESGRQEPPLRDREVRDDPMSGSTTHGRFRAAEPKQGDRGREEPAAVETPPGAYAPAGSGVTMDIRDLESERGVEMLAAEQYRAIHSMTLLDGLAEDALGTAERQTPDSHVPPSGVPVPRAARSQDSFGRVGDETREHRPSEFGSSPFSTSSQGPLDAVSDAARSREPNLLAPGPDGLPESFPRGAVPLIDALAEHLLVPNDQIAGSLPAGSVVDRSPPASLDGADRISFSSGRSDPDPSNEAASDPYMDAETFAALVNDALVRQARRHGVDLS
jgi:hypothetical protein